MPDWYRTGRDGIRINVRLTPKGGADRIEGLAELADGSIVLVARVKAVAEKGAANVALEKLVARTFEVAPTQVAIVSGLKARIKTVHVAANIDVLRPRLAELDNSKNRRNET